MILFFILFIIVHGTFSWHQVRTSTAPPAPRRSAGFTCSGSDLIVFGGKSSARRLNDLWKFNTVDNKWLQLASGPFEGRSGSCMLFESLHNKIWLLGGRNDLGLGLNDTYTYDFSSDVWQKEPSMPSGLFGSTCFFADNEDNICVFGGKKNTSSLASQNIYCLNLNNKTWQERPAGGISMGDRDDALYVETRHGRYLYLTGGRDDNKMYIFRKNTWEWSVFPTLDTLFSTTNDGLMVNLGETIVVFGGRTSSGVLNSDITWTLSSTGQWRNASISSPGKRFGVAGCALSNTAILFGGERDSVILNDLWLYSDVTTTNDSVGIAALILAIISLIVLTGISVYLIRRRNVPITV